jgi:hypothetical protein
MTRNDLPALMTLLFGCGFLAVAVLYPWLSRRFGIRRPGPGERGLAAVLGCVLLALWSMWYANA